MAVFLHDAMQMLTPEARAAYDRGDLADITFADDTLVLGASKRFLTDFSSLQPVICMAWSCIRQIAAPEFQCDSCIRTPDRDRFGGVASNFLSRPVLARVGCVGNSHAALGVQGRTSNLLARFGTALH